MPYPNQNNQQKETHINTRGVQFFNVNGFEPSTMIVGMWNQLISLRIHPAKEKSQQTKSSVYDYDRSVNIILDTKTAETLADIIEKNILPAVESGTECTKAIVVGANSAVIISTGVKRNSGRVSPYIAIARNIKPGTLLPEDMLSYTFITSMILNNYDGNAGNNDFDPKTCQVPIQSELVGFMWVLRHLGVAILGGEYHAGRNISKRYDDNLFRLYKELAAKNGIEFYSGNGNGGNGYSRGGNVFGNSDSGSFTTNIDTKPEDGGTMAEFTLDDFA